MPWLPEAHERATLELPGPAGRFRNWCRRTWRRFLHPQRLQVFLCPFCESILVDPSDNCPGCGL